MGALEAFWLVAGLVLATVLLVYCRTQSARGEKRILAAALLIAAILYVAFAFVWGGWFWILIELAGVGLYGGLVWLSFIHSGYWLALGWFTHPIWDLPLHLWGPGALVVPDWYALLCLSFDLALAAYIVGRVRHWQTEGVA